MEEKNILNILIQKLWQNLLLIKPLTIKNNITGKIFIINELYQITRFVISFN